MNLKNRYWYSFKGLPKHFCNDVIQHGKKQEAKDALIEDVKSDLTEEKLKEQKETIRNSDVSWLNDKWVYDAIIPYFNDANKSCGWNFDIDWYESVQISKYELGEMYGWHTDPMSVEYMGKNHDNYKDKMRKLSLIALLSDNFEDGNLQVALQDGEKVNIETIELSLGSIVVFPSFTWHRVTPLTKGVRHSLSMWCLGPSFK